MPLIQPFRGLRPAPGRADEVIAPPYDVLSSAEARERARSKPWSFLHISKAEIDLPEGTDPNDPAVYAKAAENMQKLIDAGVVIRDPAPCYYVYRLIWGDHVQTGLVAGASVAAYDDGRIRKHEHTQPAKEDGRVAQIEAVNGQTGPVMMAYASVPAVDALIEKAAGGTPDFDVTADDGVHHMLWVVSGGEETAELTAAFDTLPALYIADGHHRAAAASRICKKRGGAGDGSAPHASFLTVIFPHNQTKVLEYNRVVADLNGHTLDELVAAIGEKFAVAETASPVQPSAPREFGMYCEGRWFRLRIREDLVAQDDPVARLDISLLSDQVIAPLLGIEDQRRDKRIDFVGGIRGLKELERRVDSGEMAVAFSFYPTSMRDLMAVADAGEVMPTKSTWFEPKLADGMVSHMLD